MEVFYANLVIGLLVAIPWRICLHRDRKKHEETIKELKNRK